jgi:ABC-type branched-subunit amino acid transport system substrate-binding protein
MIGLGSVVLAIGRPVRAGESPPPDQAAIESLRALLDGGKFPAAKAAASEFQAKFPASPFLREAVYAARRAETGTLRDRGKVLVALPLTGEFAPPAAAFRSAIELANEESGLQLQVVDTRGNGETCVALVEKAVIESGVSLVLGPLTKDESLPCAAAAQALRTPMLALTSSDEVLAAGDMVFRATPSPAQQIDALLDATIGTRNWKRFAILHPKTPFGENAARAFTDAASARGASVAATLAYDPAATDFRALGRELGRKDYKARASEFYQVKQRIERAGGDPGKATLPPLVDFDAIFIPDSYTRAALIASALAFEEFAVGGFKPSLDSVPIPLLGLNAWNNAEWPRRGGKYVQGSIFIDAFDGRSQDAAVARFVETWQSRHKADPTVVEAVGFDTLRLAAAALATEGKSPATALAELEMSGSVAGTLGLGPDRQVRREWRMLTVLGGEIRPLGTEPAPPAP